MKIKTNELTGAALDWVVALAEGATPGQDLVICVPSALYTQVRAFNLSHCESSQYSPSTDWSQGGPIIEREIFKLFKNVGGAFTAQIKKRVPYYSPTYDADIGISEVMSYSGPTPLIAAMRCFVASKLGDEVEIPEELCS